MNLLCKRRKKKKGYESCELKQLNKNELKKKFRRNVKSSKKNGNNIYQPMSRYSSV